MLHEFNKNHIEDIIDKYGNILFRICLLISCNDYDAESAVLEGVGKYINKVPSFCNLEDEKKWLITTAINSCKKIRWYNFRGCKIDTKDLEFYTDKQELYNAIKVLMKLPYKYKIALLLYYMEGYTIFEIAKMLKISDASVRRRLQRGKESITIAYSDGEYMDTDKIKDAVNSIEMSKVMKYRIKSFIK